MEYTDYIFLSTTGLFKGIQPQEIQQILPCLQAQEKDYIKDQAVYRIGDNVSSMGIVLNGCVVIENNDLWGHTSLIDKIEKGQIFGETYAYLPAEPLTVTITAEEKTRILFLKTPVISEVCSNSCSFHNKLIKNLLELLAQKNLNLTKRISHTSPRSIRGKLLSYLSFQAKAKGSRDFMIPFSRQQLADYLNVDRSALSAEISKMQKEHILTSQKNRFILYGTENDSVDA